MARTLVATILEDHLAGGGLESGREIALRVDQTLLQDATGTMACLQFEELGLDRHAREFAVKGDGREKSDFNVLLRVAERQIRLPDHLDQGAAKAAQYALRRQRAARGALAEHEPHARYGSACE